MAIDTFQDKIRKCKNPTILDLSLSGADLPDELLAQEGSIHQAYGKFCRELLTALKGVVPAIRLSLSAFAFLGPEGLAQLSQVMKQAGKQGYYVLLDAPELWSVAAAQRAAQALLAEGSLYPCQGLILPAYPGSDCLLPFLPYCQEKGKDLFVMVRTANKSAAQLQDLMAGGRLLYTAAADTVNRYGTDTPGKHGYARVGLVAAATSAQSIQTLRKKFPNRFLLLDGYDLPGANAKNCGYAFDKFGKGAAVIVGEGITCAWKKEEGTAFCQAALEAARRIQKNLSKYVTIV